MNLLALAWLGLKRRPLSTALTVLYVALGAALALLVAQAHEATQRSFRDAARGFDLVLAPKNGSGLQAVLATMFVWWRDVVRESRLAAESKELTIELHGERLGEQPSVTSCDPRPAARADLDLDDPLSFQRP